MNRVLKIVSILLFILTISNCSKSSNHITSRSNSNSSNTQIIIDNNNIESNNSENNNTNPNIDINDTNQTDFQDKNPPVITLNGKNPQIIEVDKKYIEYGAVAIDNEDGEVNVDIIYNDVNISKVGDYFVEYRAIDRVGNEAFAQREVKVVENYTIKKTIYVGTNFKINYEGAQTIQNEPEGMTLNIKSGNIYWTPTPNQVGEHNISIHFPNRTKNLILNVLSSDIDLNNTIFISANSNNSVEDGSYEYPYKDTSKICNIDNNPTPGTIIYYRGGIYKNPNFGNSNKNNTPIPTISCKGEKNNPIIIKPWGNEKPKILFDSIYGIKITGNFLTFEGFEIEGVNQKIDYNKSISNWWIGDDYYNSNGIVINGNDITIKENIIHDTPSNSIVSKDSSNIIITDNLIFNSAWWSAEKSAGIYIIGSSYQENNNTTLQKIKIIKNLIFNTESRIFSRDWSRDEAYLTLKHGESILLEGNYNGGYLIKDNFLISNGKGLVATKNQKVDIYNNTLYNTGTTVSGDFKGIRVNSTKNSTIKSNAVKIYKSGNTLSISENSKNINIENNCFINGGKDDTSTVGVLYVKKLFVDPIGLDFTIKNSDCTSVGANMSTWHKLKLKADEYGIEIKETNYDINYTKITKDIIDSIPDNSDVDWSNWQDDQPFDLNITNIPSGTKNRPSKYLLKVLHPYKR